MTNASRESRSEKPPRGTARPRKKGVLIDTAKVTVALFSTLDLRLAGLAQSSAPLEALHELLIAEFLMDSCGTAPRLFQHDERMPQSYGRVAQRMPRPVHLTSRAICARMQHGHHQLLQHLERESEYRPAAIYGRLLNLQMMLPAVAIVIRLNDTSLPKDLDRAERSGCHRGQIAEAVHQILDRLSNSLC